MAGKRSGKEAVIFLLLEKKTRIYLAFRIRGKTKGAVLSLVEDLHEHFGEHFAEMYKTITAVNFQTLCK